MPTGNGIPYLALTASICSAISISCLAFAAFNVLGSLQVEKNENEDLKQLPLLIRMLMPFAVNMKTVVKMDIFKKMKDNAETSLQMAGYDQAISADDFIAVRLLSGLLGFALLIFFAFFSTQPLIGLLLGFLLMAYPPLWLKSTVKKRHLEILKSLPNVLDLLTLSVEAGKDFITALRDILDRRKLDALGEELRRTLHEIQLGKQRQEALKGLIKRVRQPDLSSVINAIIQAEELGVSIGQLLRIQGDQLRSKRFSRAEKLANEAPVKILFPVVTFIFPSVFIILMGPVLMQALKTLVR